MKKVSCCCLMSIMMLVLLIAVGIGAYRLLEIPKVQAIPVDPATVEQICKALQEPLSAPAIPPAPFIAGDWER